MFRWWDQYKLLPWPDSLVLLSHGLVDFSVPGAKQWLEKVMRYVMLAYVLCLRRISKALMKLFPTNQVMLSG